MVDTVSVGIVDAYPLFREGVSQTLRRYSTCDVVAEGSCYDDAVMIAETYGPEFLFLDAELSGGGLKALRRIRSSNESMKIVMLTAKQCESGLSASLAAGANGYTSKSLATSELINVISTLRNGDLYTDPSFSSKLLAARYQSNTAAPADPLDDLTARELDILKLVAESLTNKEIARRFTIAEKTVKHYMTIILRKLGARNRVEAALIARKSLFENSI